MNEPTRGRAWLEGLFDAHYERLLAYAIRRVGPDNADDVVAEVFAVAWRRRAEVPEPPVTWLYATARNTILHERRSHAKRTRLRSVLQLNREPSVDATARVEVDSVLDALDPTDAEVLRLTVWEQLTPSEIAEVLGISPTASRNRLLRARRKAQALFDRPSPARFTPALQGEPS